MNKYLEKVALNRLVKEIAKGSVSEAPYSLFQKGVLRSPTTYAKGARAANDKLQATLGVNVNRTREGSLNHLITGQAGGYATVPRRGAGPSVIFSGSSPMIGDLNIGAPGVAHAKALHGMQHQAGISHELFEADAVRRRLPKEPVKARAQRAKTMEQTTPGILASHGFNQKQVHHISRGLRDMDTPRMGANIRRSSGEQVGGHMSLDVLGRESNLVRANPYLSKSTLKDIRSYTGEDRLLKNLTGKTYGADKFSGKDLRRLDRAKPSVVEQDFDVHHVPD